MVKPTLPILAEPAFSQTHWYRSLLQGIVHEAGRKGLKPHIYLYEKEEHRSIMESVHHSGRAVLILGSSEMWEESMVEELHEAAIHPILVAAELTNTPFPFSYVGLNHTQAAAEVTVYLRKAGCTRIAYAGHTDSVTDVLKHKGITRALLAVGDALQMEDIYWNQGTTSYIDQLVERIDNYDAIICSNDIAAILLMQKLSASDLARCYIVGFGDHLVSRLHSPSLTTVTLDYEGAGRKAVDLYLYLTKHEEVTSSSITVGSRIQIRESTFLRSFEERERSTSHRSLPRPQAPSLHSDSRIQQLFRLEHVLQQCDELDAAIIRELFHGITYEAMEESLNLSVTAIKYRIKKLVAELGVQDKTQMLALITQYLGPRAADKLLDLTR
ncbi:substrate-binding domain-containing protein [Paenibacillus sp. GCM10023252]|uniref:substrate-binding domain-containing protein n=1 Tax=Paenibacillus sp. GCM10023252 TaxID=3252649 RepID=UPI0036090231